MRALVRLLAVSLFVAFLVAVQAPAASAAAEPSPVLVERAIESGTLDFSTGHRYLAYSLFAPEKLPSAYQSDAPFHGAVWLLKVRRAVERMPLGVERAEIEALVGVGPADIGTSICELSPLPNTNVLETEHFYIEYNAAEVDFGPDGLTIDDYAQSLEGAWRTEVDAFGWAAPPSNPANPAPAGKYLVKVQQLSPVLYGYVSSFGTGAGEVGDNPNTSWNDEDATASCMGLNSDYAFFPGSPARALDATTAHEFNHSIQFGYGALSGDNEPDSVFVEAGATWMEDEVYDYANDNYNYLWPVFENDMGEYEDSPYPYWITFRGLTERYGASVPGAGEDVMQTFWELTSRNEASNLQAIDLALRTHGTTLPNAYHAYAVAVKFNRRCGGGYVYPYCFEEGREYVSGDGVQTGAGETEPHGEILQVSRSFTGSVPDNYALNWVVLPQRSKSYRVTLTNDSAGGSFRVSLACDTGSKLTVTALKGLAGPGGTIQGTASKSLSCEQLVAVITNVAQTAANPDTSEERAYTLLTD